MAKKTTTAKKAGLTVARNGNKFILTWTPIKDCDDQDIKVYVNNKLKRTADLGKTTKKYTYEISRSDWYPNSGKKKLTEVAFRLARKQKKKKESSYSEQKEFKIEIPGRPTYVAPSMDNEHHDTFTYAWERNPNDGNSKTSHKMFTRYYWETCLVDNGKDAKWSLAESQKITIITQTTHTTLIDQNSYGTVDLLSDIPAVTIVEKQSDITAKKRRYFRVRAIGPAGMSAWRESTHRLGGTVAVSIPREDTNYIGSDSTGTSGSIALDISKGNPEDTIEVQYAIVVPKVNVEVDGDIVRSTLSLPDNFESWNSIDTFTGIGKPDTYTFKIPDRIVNNTVLFIRVNRIHDNITSYGRPRLMNYRKPVSPSTEEDSEEYLKRTTTVTFPLSAPLLTEFEAHEDTKTVDVSVTNATEMEGSYIAVYQSIGDEEKVIGIIPYGTTNATFPGDWNDDDNPVFGIKCFVADYSPAEREPSGITEYSIGPAILMASSGMVWQRDLVSKPPIIKALYKHDNTTAYIEWEWTWDQADSVEISWSDNRIIWDSTDAPSSYILSNSRNGYRYVTGLSAGTYYFRLRFIKNSGDTIIYGKYSDINELLMSAAPTTPSLTLSDEDGIVAEGEEITAYWKYKSNDGTVQNYAQLAEATRVDSGSPWTYTELPNASTNTDSHIKFTPSDYGWNDDLPHYVSVRVTSASGQKSEGWSEPQQIIIAPKPEINITGIGGVNDDIVSVDNETDGYIYKLVSIPLRFTVDGFGGDGFCSVVIERAANYEIERPDDTTLIGFDGETIVSKIFRPEDGELSVNVDIDTDDLIGRLDNSAQYLMVVSITDKYGQTDKAEYPFTVVWDYYAQMPSAEIIIDPDNDLARITPTAPLPVDEGDYCQIYRLSADKPQLVLDYGSFDTEYIDIYPTYGYFGGYRIVYVTKYGDYKTEDNTIAMTEYSKSGNDEDIDSYDKFMVSIKFDDNLIEFPGNISISNSWGKDFQTTRYLGGSIQGDWNPSIQRTGTINGSVPVEQEAETLYGLRLLADYAGVCHVRTPEGSNFYGDIQVRDDREEKWVNKISKISLSYTKVDGKEDELQPSS